MSLVTGGLPDSTRPDFPGPDSSGPGCTLSACTARSSPAGCPPVSGTCSTLTTPCSSCTYRRPRSSEATAAIRQAAIAKSKAMARPLEKEGEISAGKKLRPVR